MQKKSGAGINLIFFVLALILTGAIVAICFYTYFHKSKHESEPANSKSITETTEITTTSTSTTLTSNSSISTTTTVSTISTTTASKISKLKYHNFNETLAAEPSDDTLTLSQEDSGDLFNYYPNSKWIFNKFANKAEVGIDKGKDGSSVSYYINNTNVNNSKSDIGFKAEIKNNQDLFVESYGGDLKELKIVSNNNKYSELKYKTDIKKGTLEADLTDNSYPNGIYVINGEYTVDNKTLFLNIYLYINCKSDEKEDYKYYLCWASQDNNSISTIVTDTTTTNNNNAITTKAE